MALLLASAIPAAAQSLGVGLSFLGDEGGTGVIVDYSAPLQKTVGERQLNWVADLSFHHNGFGSDFVGFEGGVNTLMIQGGVRIGGAAGEKVNWHAQGLVGIRRTSFSTEAAGIPGELCDDFGIDCEAGDSDTGGLLTIGGAVEYAFQEKMSARAQLDFPIGLGGDAGSTTRFSIMLIFKRGQ